MINFDIHVYLDLLSKYLMLALRLSNEIETRLSALALKTGRTKTYYARQAILSFIDEMEDTYLAIDRLETPAKIWTQEDLEADLDLAN